MPRHIGRKQIVVDGRELMTQASFENPATQELIEAGQRIEIIALLAQLLIQATQHHTDDQLCAPLAAAPWDGLTNWEGSQCSCWWAKGEAVKRFSSFRRQVTERFPVRGGVLPVQPDHGLSPWPGIELHRLCAQWRVRLSRGSGKPSRRATR